MLHKPCKMVKFFQMTKFFCNFLPTIIKAYLRQFEFHAPKISTQSRLKFSPFYATPPLEGSTIASIYSLVVSLENAKCRHSISWTYQMTSHTFWNLGKYLRKRKSLKSTLSGNFQRGKFKCSQINLNFLPYVTYVRTS